MSQKGTMPTLEECLPKNSGYIKCVAWKASQGTSVARFAPKDLLGLFDQEGNLISMFWNWDYGYAEACNNGIQVFTLH